MPCTGAFSAAETTPIPKHQERGEHSSLHPLQRYMNQQPRPSIAPVAEMVASTAGESWMRSWVGHRGEDEPGNSAEVKGNILMLGKIRLAH